MELTIIEGDPEILEIDDFEVALELDVADPPTLEIEAPTVSETIEILAGLKGDKGDPGEGGASDWADITGKPTTFTPSAHTHVIADTTGLQTALDLKAPLASPTFTGTVTIPTLVGTGTYRTLYTSLSANTTLGSHHKVGVNATAGAITITLPSAASIGGREFIVTKTDSSGNAVNLATTSSQTIDGAAPGSLTTQYQSIRVISDGTNWLSMQGHIQPISSVTGLQSALDLKAPLASPTFTGTVSGITKTMVGLSNVDNTADTAKPVSTAQQTALNLKANLASPTFTGTVIVPDGSFTIAKTTGLQAALDAKVSSVNGSTGVVVLEPADIGASPEGHTHVSADITDLTTGADGEDGITSVPPFTTSSIATGTGTLRWYNDSGRSLSIVAVRVVVSATGTGSSTLVDVNVNGTTIWGTQSNRTTVTAGNTTGISTTINSPIISNGQYLTVDIDQISTFAGGTTLTVFITAV